MDSSHQKEKKTKKLHKKFSTDSFFPSYTDLTLPYRVICRQRYHRDGTEQRLQFRRELKGMEAMQSRALDGVRLHREFCNPILSYPVPDKSLYLSPEEKSRCGANPLSIWDQTVKNGHIRRVVDDEVKSLVLEISGTNVSTTYIVSPCTKRDDKNMRRRFRVSNFQSTTKVRPFCTTMPIGLSSGWNQIQFNLADFTRRAYGSTYLETQKVQINANVRIRRIYFSDRLYSDDEMPQEFKLFIPMSQSKEMKKDEKKEEEKPKEPVVEEPSKTEEELPPPPSEEQAGAPPGTPVEEEPIQPESPGDTTEESPPPAEPLEEGEKTEEAPGEEKEGTAEGEAGEGEAGPEGEAEAVPAEGAGEAAAEEGAAPAEEAAAEEATEGEAPPAEEPSEAPQTEEVAVEPPAEEVSEAPPQEEPSEAPPVEEVSATEEAPPPEEAPPADEAPPPEE